MNQKSAVITGPTGAVGIALIQKLIVEGYFVYAVIRPDSNRKGNIPVNPAISIIECDISALSKLPDLIKKKCDIFYHLAWEGTTGDARNDKELQDKNVKHALDAVSAAKKLGCGIFVGAGSQAEYGRVEGLLKPDTPTTPENEYGRGKLQAGILTRKLCQDCGMKHIWVRILSVYGPNDGEKSMIMSSIKKMKAGDVCQFTKGEQMWDYLFSSDAADALYLLGENGIDGNIYCLGSGKVRPLAEYINIMRNLINPNAEIQLGAVPYAEKQVMYLCADISKLQRDTGFSPRIEFEEGIELINKSLSK